MNTGTESLAAHCGDHGVLFYNGDAELAGRVAGYLAGALRQGGTSVMIAAPDHRLAIGNQLAREGTDLAAARASGSYVELDAAETMNRFMVGGWPDPASFWRAVSPLLARQASTGKPVRVYGEMVALLWDAGLVGSAIEVEAMWNELARHHDFALLCAYPAGSVSGDGQLDALTEVCRLHTAAEGAPEHVPGSGPTERQCR